MTTLVVLFVLLIGGGLIVGYEVIRSQYYVGDNGGKVAIFRGINDKILGFKLYSVYQPTAIPVAGITAASAQEVHRAATGSLPMARQFLTVIRNQYDTCQDAYADLRSWIAHKPKPIKKKVHIGGRTFTRKITPKYRPKPSIPAYCPPQPPTHGT